MSLFTTNSNLFFLRLYCMEGEYTFCNINKSTSKVFFREIMLITLWKVWKTMLDRGDIFSQTDC